MVLYWQIEKASLGCKARLQDMCRLIRLHWIPDTYHNVYRIYPKYSDTSTPYHICSKIWTSTTHFPMLCLKIAGWMANSVDPVETPRSAASHLGLNCLLRPVCPNTYGKYGIVFMLWLVTKISIVSNPNVYISYKTRYVLVQKCKNCVISKAIAMTHKTLLAQKKCKFSLP